MHTHIHNRVYLGRFRQVGYDYVTGGQVYNCLCFFVTYVNASCRTYDCIRLHMWMSHVGYICEWVMSHIGFTTWSQGGRSAYSICLNLKMQTLNPKNPKTITGDRVIAVVLFCNTYKYVITHTSTIVVTDMNKSCRTYEYVIIMQISVSHDTHM